MPTATDIRRIVMRYHGGKFRMGPRIIRYFPPHERYTEAESP